MAIIDKGLGIPLITLGDLLDEEPTSSALDGATVQRHIGRARVKRFDDGKPMGGFMGTVAAVTEIQFWVIIDCGEPGTRFRPRDHPGQPKEPRRDRYVPVGVGIGQDIADVEREEEGTALPEVYYSWDAACEASSDLCAVAEIHES